MSIRLVAVDVDGTLRHLRPARSAARAGRGPPRRCAGCRARSVHRPGDRECWYVLDALPEDRYAVTHTGAMAQDLKTGELLYHCPLSADDARLIYSHLRPV